MLGRGLRKKKHFDNVLSEPYHKYSIWVRAFTAKHEGKESEKIDVMISGFDQVKFIKILFSGLDRCKKF